MIYSGFILMIVLILAQAGWAGPDKKASLSAKEVIQTFYRSYLASKPGLQPVSLHPEFSDSFQKLIEMDAKVCPKGDICAWPGDADPYLDAQDFDPTLDYDNSGITVIESNLGVVEARINIFPHEKNADGERTVIYSMVREQNRWKVDNIVLGSWSARQEIQNEIKGK